MIVIFLNFHVCVTEFTSGGINGTNYFRVKGIVSRDSQKVAFGRMNEVAD